MPVGRTGYAASGVVLSLVACRALQAGNSLTCGATRDGRHVQMRIEALLGRVAFRMTVQAAWVGEHPMDVREQLFTLGLSGDVLSRGGAECEEASKKEGQCLRYPHKYDCIISQLDKNTVREPA